MSTPRRLNRRSFLALGGAAGLAAAAGGVTGMGWLHRPSQSGAQLTSSARLPEPFTVPLPFPAVATPAGSAAADLYRITARPAEIEVLPGLQTPMLTYDGVFPGPTIVSRRGRRTVVEHINKLPVPEVVHLHGGHTPPESDGFPIDLVLPQGMSATMKHDGMSGMTDHLTGDTSSGSRSYTYPMQQRAATLWYHDHRMDFTSQSVYHGLAGFHLVHDDEDDATGLPTGDRDLPLMIADRAFNADGSLNYPALDPTMMHTVGVRAAYMSGVLGDVVLVNGAPWPLAEVDAAKYRLRLLNGSNARRYSLRLDPPPPSGAGFVQVGSDGGLLAAPIQQSAIVLAPAERFDVVIDFAAYPVGTDVTVVNDFGAGGTAQVLRFHVARTAKDDARIPEKLSTIEDLRSVSPVRTRTFKFSQGGLPGNAEGWLINGKPFDPDRADADPHLGEVERWRFVSDAHHPIHVHLDPFQVVDRAGRGTVGDYDHGWKDTVDVVPAEVVEVAVRFSDYTGKYLLHCHNLEHEDMAMMSMFRTRKG